MSRILRYALLFFTLCNSATVSCLYAVDHNIFMDAHDDAHARQRLHVYPFDKVGPIIRNVTDSSLAFIGQARGNKPSILEYFRPSCIAKTPNETILRSVIRIEPTFQDDTVGAFLFPMNVIENYYVSYGEVTGLKSDTAYTIHVGYVHIPSSHNVNRGDTNQIDPHNFNWDDAHQMVIRTCIHPHDILNQFSDPFSILVGSCRRISLEDMFTRHWAKKGDKTFRAMRENILNHVQSKTNAIVMIGDQIYADGAGPLREAKTTRDYAKLYTKAFSQPHIRELMGGSGIPTFMMCDDHEFFNDVDAVALALDQNRRDAAWFAYSMYQRPQGIWTPTPWFTSKNGLEMFFFDTRTERNWAMGQIISQKQMDAAKEWVSDPSRADLIADLIKVFFTSVPFFLLDNNDSWAGFPYQRLELLHHLMEHNIRYVMFVSGDAHCHNQGLFKIYDDQNTDTGRAFLEVLVSGFFAVSHQKADNLVHEVPLRLYNKTIQYTARADPLKPTLTHNRLFGRLSGNHNTHDVRVQIYDHKNTVLREEDYTLN